MTEKASYIWLVAAENGALPGGKVGGVGDVLHHLPLALAEQGLRVRVVTPAYGVLHRLPGARRHRRVALSFGGRPRRAAVFRLGPDRAPVEQFVIEHALLRPRGPGRIYDADPPGEAYATDAGKFAFFNAAVAAWVEQANTAPDVLHLHDWHAGLLPALRARAPRNGALARVRMVFTIHNLAYQGIRPQAGHRSSLQAWFPGAQRLRAAQADPRYPDCVNFMASAISAADVLNTVSPSYAREILEPPDPRTGAGGGEGLESLLQAAFAAGRLSGILNGCDYPEPPPRPVAWPRLRAAIRNDSRLLAANPAARRLLERLGATPPDPLLISIGRVVGQKVDLFLQAIDHDRSALEAVLDEIAPGGLFIMLGSGEPGLERRLTDIAARRDNFLFLRGYAEGLADALYASGDLFLMPSRFEPCGISQMLAMRAGQPCVVHAVGGLRDTVTEGATGFCFEGGGPGRQARAFVAAVRRALALRHDSPAQWQALREAARAERFTWARSAAAYIEQLYRDGEQRR